MAIAGQVLVHADVAGLHAPTQGVAVVPLVEHEFAQVDGHAAQRVVDHGDHVLHLGFAQRGMLLALLDAFDLVLAFLDFTVEEFDALAGVGGQLHARVLDFHDDAVGLRAGQGA